MQKDFHEDKYMNVIELLDDAFAYCYKCAHVGEHVKNEIEVIWNSTVVAYATMLDFAKFVELRNERLCDIIDNLQDDKLIEILCDVWMLFNDEWIEYMKNQESEA